MSIVNAISFPSGDHAAPLSERVKYKSSIGTGRAPEFAAERIDCGSVRWRSSGPADCASRQPGSIRATKLTIVGAMFIGSLPGDVCHNATGVNKVIEFVDRW